MAITRPAATRYQNAISAAKYGKQSPDQPEGLTWPTKASGKPSYTTQRPTPLRNAVESPKSTAKKARANIWVARKLRARMAVGSHRTVHVDRVCEVVRASSRRLVAGAYGALKTPELGDIHATVIETFIWTLPFPYGN